MNEELFLALMQQLAREVDEHANAGASAEGVAMAVNALIDHKVHQALERHAGGFLHQRHETT